MLVERRTLVAARFSADAPGAPLGPPTVLNANASLPIGDGFADVGHRPGRWLAAARRLPDGSLALALADHCGEATETLHVTAERTRSLGRMATGTCAPIDASMDWLSPDARWFRADRVSDALEPGLHRLDTPQVRVPLPACPGRAGAPTNFAAWDGDGAVLAAAFDHCLMRVDLDTGAAREVPLPDQGCRAVVGEGDRALRVGAALLLDCEAGLQALSPEGGVETLAAGWRLDHEVAPQVDAGGTSLVVHRDAERALLRLPVEGAPWQAPLAAGAQGVHLVLDGGAARPALVTFEGPPEGEALDRVRLFSVEADGLRERLSASLPGGAVDSVVVGDAALGPLFVAMGPGRDRPQRTLHAVRGAGRAAEVLATTADACGVLPWHGEPSLALWNCAETTAMDLRGETLRTWPLGHVVTALTSAGHMEAFGYEAEAEVAVVDDSGRLRRGSAAPGVPTLVGTDAEGVSAVLRAPPRLGAPAPGRVDLHAPGASEPLATLTVEGEVLGFVAGQVVTLHQGRLSAQGADGLPVRRFEVPGLPGANVRLSDAGGGVAFALDAAGRLLRLELDTGEARVVALRLPPAPLRALHHDAALEMLVLGLESTPPMVFALSADPDAPAERPMAALFGAGVGFAPGADGAGPIGWNAQGVYRLCVGACEPERLSAAFGAAYRLTPDGRHLFDLRGYSVSLDAPDAVISPMCDDVGICAAERSVDGSMQVQVSTDGARVILGDDMAFRPADGRAAWLASLAPGEAGALVPLGAMHGPDGVVSVSEFHPEDQGPRLRFEFRDPRLQVAAVRTLEAPELSAWALSGRALSMSGGAELGVIHSFRAPDDPTSRLLAVDARLGGDVTVQHTVPGLIRHAW
jgi:hypothetical protein